ncbi:hypothetical protein F4X73_02285 [Candidatus Poribacteria bacterium]|nr:hypothetical protein [Candidatus Poribacteria bacterium]
MIYIYNWYKYVIVLIIGGLLVAFGYLIGDSTPDVDAQDSITRFDTIQCKGLIVSDGNPEHGYIVLTFLDGSPTLVLSDHSDPNKAKIGIDLSTQDNAAALRLKNLHNDGSHIGLVAGRGETAIMTFTTQKRVTDALTLSVGAKGAMVSLENETVNFKFRKR